MHYVFLRNIFTRVLCQPHFAAAQVRPPLPPHILLHGAVEHEDKETYKNRAAFTDDIHIDQRFYKATKEVVSKNLSLINIHFYQIMMCLSVLVMAF